MIGPYDEGYKNCDHFWGIKPSSLVLELSSRIELSGLRAIDVGCGDGKNAAYLTSSGATVRAIDSSELAVANARRLWPSVPLDWWEVGDIRHLSLTPTSYDLVVAYGVLHCLADVGEVERVVRHLQGATIDGGYHVICAFNDRYQDLSAHPGFDPTLLPHGQYCSFYRGWEIVKVTDQDLVETHPHNMLQHTHSMTRILARRPTVV